MVGVALAQVAQVSGKEAGAASRSGKLFGMAILLAAALCSSLAAVSFEKLLKGVKVSLWTRNLQLAGFSILLGGLSLVSSTDGARVLEGGFFQRYTALTWLCICMNAFGGLLVGAVINYADAILKDVAIGASIVVAALGSSALYDFRPSSAFIFSVALVSYAVPMYAGRAYLFGQCDVFSLYKTRDPQPAMAYLNIQADDVEIAAIVGRLDAKK
jgi:UDP-sugar transporter A1/2/3